MKEKYIFFILLAVALAMFIGSGLGKKAQGEISAGEKVLEEKLRQAARIQPALPQRIDIAGIQNLVPFSYYEGLLQRSPFFRVRPRQARGAQAEKPILAVEEQTPLFLYKGKILAAGRSVVIIEQTRLDETFMVSQGENIGMYKVLDITDTEVILSKKGEDNIILKTIERP